MKESLRGTWLAALAGLLAASLGCGSGVKVAVSPSEYTLRFGGQMTFVAQVTGTANTKVTWSIDEGDSGGSVSAGGLYQPTATGEFHVRATSVADKGQSAAALVTVEPIPPVEVRLAPASATVTTGSSQTFTAIVTGASVQTVTWTVEEVGGGTVSTGGTYAAPALAGTYHLVATSDADSTKSARAEVTVTASQVVSVSVSPDVATVFPYGSAVLLAQVFGAANTQVTWSLGEACAGCSVSATGVFRAGSEAGTYHVVATSVADPTKSAQATLTVQPAGGVSVSVSPATATVQTLGTRFFYASVSGSTNTQVTWSVVDAGGGTISTTGSYTAPGVPGTFRVCATSVADASRRGYATVSVTSNVTIAVTPTTATVAPGQSASFSALVTGSTNQTVTWSVVEAAGGTATSTGASTATYTAPALAGTYHVMARSQADTARTATATLTVQAGLLSGTILFTGGSTGRVYIVASDAAGKPLAGTSLASPGPYTLRGLKQPGMLKVRAFLDVLGTGVDNDSADPSGEATVTWTASGATADVTLVASAAATPGQPAAPTVYPGDSGALVRWSPLRTLANVEHPDQYVIYWSTTASPGPANMAGSKPVTARSGGYSYVSGLTNGTNYYFAVAGVARATAGSPSVGTAAVRIGPNAGPATLTGWVSAATGLTGPTYVVAISATAPTYFVRYPVGSASLPFSIAGLSNGATYKVVSFMDVAGEGELNATDPRTFDTPVTVVVAGASANAGTLTLPSGDSTGRAPTAHLRSGVTETYELELSIAAGLKFPVKASAASTGCTVGTGPIDIPIYPALGPGAFRAVIALPASTPPVVTSCYLDVTYSDGTISSIYSPIRGVVSAFATPVSPTGTAGTTPTFTWTSPGTPPPSYTQNLSVLDSAGATLWRLTGMASSLTSVTYNSDGLASPATLPAGASFSWGIEVQDAYGDRSVVLTPFGT